MFGRPLGTNIDDSNNIQNDTLLQICLKCLGFECSVVRSFGILENLSVQKTNSNTLL